MESDSKDRIHHKRKCHANNEKRKQQMTTGIELLNPKTIRTRREKETYKGFGILDTDTTKQVGLKWKIKNNISEERETILNQTALQESHQRDK